MGWLKARPVWVTLLLLALWGAYEAHAMRAGERKLEGTPYTNGEAKAALAVTMDFPPETFHLALLQQAGRLIRVEDRTAFLVDVPAADGPVKMVASPVDFYGTPWLPKGPVPELGQHTEEVLLELGFEWEQIAGLKEKGAIP